MHLVAPELKFTAQDLGRVDAVGSLCRLRQHLRPRGPGTRHRAAWRLPREPARSRSVRHQAAFPAQPQRAHRRLGAACRRCTRTTRPRSADARSGPSPRGACPDARRRASMAFPSDFAPFAVVAMPRPAFVDSSKSTCGRFPSSPFRCCPKPALLRSRLGALSFSTPSPPPLAASAPAHSPSPQSPGEAGVRGVHPLGERNP